MVNGKYRTMPSGRTTSRGGTTNPFDSDHSVSEASRQSRGVVFDLEAIAASRRAMISGTAPSSKPIKESSTCRGSGKTRLNSRSQQRQSQPRMTKTNSADIEAGHDREAHRKLQQVRTLETHGVDEHGFDFHHPVVVDSKQSFSDDQASESDGGNDSDSDDSKSASSDDTDGSLEKKRVGKPYVYAVLGMVTIMLVVGIIVLSVVVFGGKKGSDKSQMLVLTARQEALNDIIHTVVEGDILKDSETPQYRAHQWLLYEDPLGLAPDSGASNDRVIQRYSLAVFYFATGGPETWKPNKWMTGDECEDDWDGVGCTDDGVVHVLSLSK